MTQTPVEWLMENFEKVFAVYDGKPWMMADDLGVAEPREMIELIDDMADHAWPRCYLCGWLDEEARQEAERDERARREASYSRSVELDFGNGQLRAVTLVYPAYWERRARPWSGRPFLCGLPPV